MCCMSLRRRLRVRRGVPFCEFDFALSGVLQFDITERILGGLVGEAYVVWYDRCVGFCFVELMGRVVKCGPFLKGALMCDKCSDNMGTVECPVCAHGQPCAVCGNSGFVSCPCMFGSQETTTGNYTEVYSDESTRENLPVVLGSARST